MTGYLEIKKHSQSLKNTGTFVIYLQLSNLYFCYEHGCEKKKGMGYFINKDTLFLLRYKWCYKLM